MTKLYESTHTHLPLSFSLFKILALTSLLKLLSQVFCQERI